MSLVPFRMTTDAALWLQRCDRRADVVVGVCPDCNDLGLLGTTGRCWMCGGWEGREYPFKVALRVSDMLKGSPA